MYDKHMALLRDFIKGNKTKELLDKLNGMLTEEVWNKYCVGSISRWEMDSVSFYSPMNTSWRGLRSELYNVSDFKNFQKNR